MNAIAPITVRPVQLEGDAPSRPCAKCGAQASILVKGKRSSTTYCVKHARFIRMRATAKYAGKTVPTLEELEQLIPIDMRCPACSRTMNWLMKDGGSTAVTLQHDRDGSHRLICHACNTRHASLPGDLIYQLASDERWCQGCKSVKNQTDFYASNDAERRIKRTAECKSCSDRRHAKYVANNRARVNRYNVERYRAQRSEQT